MKAHFTATARTISVRITTLVMTLIMALTLALPASAAANETNITTPSGIPLSEIDARIADLVNQHIGTTTPGAAVAVIQNGEIVSLQNFGYAHLADEIPVNNQSVFEYGSISKLFTYTAAMQLVEQGKLDLDTDIREYFSAEFAQQWPHTQTVTMRDLMNHAGGFGDFPFSTLELSPDNIVSLEETLLNQHPQQYFTPGTASSYSNFGTALAGYIVESIVGKPFYQIQQEMIFEPAGMTLAAGEPQQLDNERVRETKAQGYMPNGQGGFVERGWSYSPLYPAGSVNGTVQDLALFAAALMPADDGQTPLFENSATLQQMLSPSYDTTGDMRGMYHGFFSLSGAVPTLGHGGDTAGFGAQLSLAPEQGFGLAVLTNGAGEMDIRFGLHELLFGSEQPSVDAGLQSADLPHAETVAGSYIFMQVPKGNILEFIAYLAPLQVEATGENTIALHMGPLTGNFVQTTANNYQLQADSHPMFLVFPTISFLMTDDEVSQVVVGNGMDLIPVASQRSAAGLVTSAIAALAGILFFLIAPVVILVQTIRQRRARKIDSGNVISTSKARRYQTVLSLLGTVLVLNNLGALGSFMANNYRSFSTMVPHIALNYVIVALAIPVAALLVYSLVSKQEQKISKLRTIIAGATIALLGVFTATLISWNFFTLFI